MKKVIFTITAMILSHSALAAESLSAQYAKQQQAPSMSVAELQELVKNSILSFSQSEVAKDGKVFIAPQALNGLVCKVDIGDSIVITTRQHLVATAKCGTRQFQVEDSGNVTEVQDIQIGVPWWDSSDEGKVPSKSSGHAKDVNGNDPPRPIEK